MDEVNTDNSEVIARLTRERDEALAEAQEQARLLGMSAERELDLRTENERLAQCCTQRGARMQIMREWMREFPAYSHRYATMWDQFAARKDALPWFDDDGVPT